MSRLPWEFHVKPAGTRSLVGGIGSPKNRPGERSGGGGENASPDPASDLDLAFESPRWTHQGSIFV